jgi:hypothetical protein
MERDYFAPLEQWFLQVSHNLDMIEAGASIIARHVKRLPFRPNFETKAEAEMAEVERRLDYVLGIVRNARAKFAEKRVDG